jgi:DNA repair protein RecN (Recombination protein N)
LKKHGLQQTNQLIKLRDELEAKINVVQEMSSEIDQLEKEVSVLKQDAMELATKISANRQKQIKPFISKVNELLHRVGMPHAGIQVDMKICEINRSGIDAVEFLFQANLSKRGEAQAFQPLGKVASGGELSRLMLCIKSLVAEGLHMPTLIFDEIDSGISGEAAKQVAAIMKELSVSHQLIAITHQPQIAARADTHYFVYKEMKDGKIVSRLRQLDNEGRITAIARMLGGEKPTAAAMANAREMVEHP